MRLYTNVFMNTKIELVSSTITKERLRTKKQLIAHLPLITAPYHTEEPSPTFTLPIIDALGATNPPVVGVAPPRATLRSDGCIVSMNAFFSNPRPASSKVLPTWRRIPTAAFFTPSMCYSTFCCHKNNHHTQFYNFTSIYPKMSRIKNSSSFLLQ